MKVLMLAEFPYQDNDLYRGGVLQANYRLITALARCPEIELQVLASTRAVASGETRKLGQASVLFWPIPWHDTLLLFRGLRRALHQVVTDFRPDIVHAQGFPPYIFAGLNTGVPCIITVHGVLRNEYPLVKAKASLKRRLKAFAISQLEAYNFARIRNLIAITAEIERLVRASSPHVRVFRIDNAIDDRFFILGEKNSKPVVLFVGWVVFRKGLHLLLQAVDLLVRGNQEIEVRIAGLEEWDPPYASSLRRKHADLMQSGRVSFLGGISQEQLYEELSRCALLCLPSLAESAPMVIAQAMAAGKPVVASRIGGIPDMVEDGSTGVLFDPGNVSDLAECLKELLSDRPRRLSMGKGARELARARYSPDLVAKKTIEAYHEVVSARE